MGLYTSVIKISTRWPLASAQQVSQQLQQTTMDSLPPSLHHALENIKYHAKDILSVISGCMCQQQSRLKINGRMCTYPTITRQPEARTQRNFLVKIVKVLGEGGFSFVYLAQDEASGVSASLCDYDRVITTDANRVGSERVCPEENSVPNWRRGCRSSHARSRGIPEIQVRPHPYPHHLPAKHPFLRHPNTIQLYVSNMHLSSPQGLMLTLCRIRQYCKILAAKAKSSTSSSPSTRPAFPRLVQFCRVFLTCNAARKLTRRNKHIYPNRRTFFGATPFAPLQGHLRSRACHASLSL